MAEDIVPRIISATGLSVEEVDRRIAEKQRELSNLVSREGAAYIVAKELGLDLSTRQSSKTEIKSLTPGIRSVRLQARVVRIFEPREFEREGKKGKVANIILGDGTGNCRLSLWDEQVSLIEKLQPGQAIEIGDGYSKDDGRGGVEIRLGRYGHMKLLEDSDLPEVSQVQNGPPIRENVNALKEGQAAEVRASIVQLFETEQFYEICPEDGSRLKQEKIEIQPGIEATVWKCAQHGMVKPQLTAVVSGVIDDGSGSIRAVFFRDLAAKLLGMTPEEMAAKRGKLFEDLDVVSKELVITGKVRKNKMFERLEFIATDIKEVEPAEEAKRLLNLFASNTGV